MWSTQERLPRSFYQKPAEDTPELLWTEATPTTTCPTYNRAADTSNKLLKEEWTRFFLLKVTLKVTQPPSLTATQMESGMLNARMRRRRAILHLRCQFFNNTLVLQWHLAVTRDAANFTSFAFAHRYVVYFPCIENEYKDIQNIFHTHYGCVFSAGGLLALCEVVGNCRWNTGTVEHLSNFFFLGDYIFQ